MLKYSYKIKKKAKEAGDVIVEKHGLCTTFTLRDLNHELNDAVKGIREYEANAKFNGAAMENVLRNNAWLAKIIAGLDAKKLFAMQLYFTSKAKHGMYSDLTKQSKRTLATLRKEDKEIRALVTKK
jgi:hypothetical protein